MGGARLRVQGWWVPMRVQARVNRLRQVCRLHVGTPPPVCSLPTALCWSALHYTHFHADETLVKYMTDFVPLP